MVVPEVRLLVFNKRITNYLYEHALLKIIKVTSPPSFCTMVKRVRSQYTTTMESESASPLNTEQWKLENSPIASTTEPSEKY